MATRSGGDCIIGPSFTWQNWISREDLVPDMAHFCWKATLISQPTNQPANQPTDSETSHAWASYWNVIVQNFHRLRSSASPEWMATGFVNGKGQFSTPHRIDILQIQQWLYLGNGLSYQQEIWRDDTNWYSEP